MIGLFFIFSLSSLSVVPSGLGDNMTIISPQ
jgi:hypothetical protein